MPVQQKQGKMNKSWVSRYAYLFLLN